jgi:hypothetical protein
MKVPTNEVSTRPTNLLSNQLADLKLNNFCSWLIIVKHVHGYVHEHHQRSQGIQIETNDARITSNQGALASIWQRIPSSKLHNFGLISVIRKLHNKKHTQYELKLIEWQAIGRQRIVNRTSVSIKHQWHQQRTSWGQKCNNNTTKVASVSGKRAP